VELRYQLSAIPWYLNPRVIYSWDSHIIGPDAYVQLAQAFDYVLLASKIDTDTLNDRGLDNVLWVPEACNPRIHKDFGVTRPNILGYIGNHNGDWVRKGSSKDDFLRHLKESKYELKQTTGVYGGEYTVEMNKIKIMFDRCIVHNIGTRLFESAAAGCLPLWSKAGFNNGIDRLMVDGLHYLSYDDTIDGVMGVLESIDEEKISSITSSAKEHVLNNHTYAHRVWKLLKDINIDFFSIKEGRF
jgi:hypothetical protein